MKSFLLFLISALFIVLPASAQNSGSDSASVWIEFDKHFGAGVGADIGIYTPQKYGGGISLYFGVRQKAGTISTLSNRPTVTINEFYGVSLDAGLYGGGYRLALSMFAYNTSFISGGGKLGVAYYTLNSSSWFAESQNLIGIEFDTNLHLQLRAGLLYDLNRTKLIPSFGIGFSLNPRI